MKKISIFLMATLGIFFSSCDSGFDEMLVDPNRPRPDQIETDLLLANTLRQTQAATYNVGWAGDMGMCWSQLWSKVQYNDEERYIPRRPVIDLVWSTLYANVIYDAKVMSSIAASKGNKGLEGVGLIVQANAFQILTDLYGPVPFTEACIKGIDQPKYDSEKTVYEGVVAMLTKADALLATGQGTLNPTSDVVYAGDFAKWRKLANALKFKALMRIADVPGTNVNAQLQAIFNSGNLMTSNDDSANVINKSDAALANPFPGTLATRLEYKVSSVLVSNLNALTDPRLKVFAKPVSGTTYVGNIPGNESLNYAGMSAVGAFYNSNTLPGVIMSYAQQELYIAEAAIEGKISGGAALSKTHFENGVTANFLFNGLTAADATTYLAQPSLSYTDAATGSPIIGKQMWFALYGQGFEAWTEWRRTKFPALSPVQNADVNVGAIPSRLFYSTVEETNNQANIAYGVSLLPGGNKLTSKIWWMN